jgi:hypothetical protein
MKALGLVIVASIAGVVLAGCVSDEEAARQKFANIQRSCKTMGYSSGQELANCEQSMAILTQQAAAERAERAERVGQALQNAGAALSAAAPPPPAPPMSMRCQTFGNQTTCNQF